MKKSSEKFLEFNGKNIYFQAKNGQYWIAIKPICEVLNVNYDRAQKNLKEDEILGQLYAIQHMVAADGALRKMVCLPEKWVYGWLFGIRSESEGLKEFKRECYEVLYNHFHGGIRKELLSKQVRVELNIETLQNKFNEEMANSDTYKDLQELHEELRTIKKHIAQKEKEERMGMRDMYEHTSNN